MTTMRYVSYIVTQNRVSAQLLLRRCMKLNLILKLLLLLLYPSLDCLFFFTVVTRLHYALALPIIPHFVSDEGIINTESKRARAIVFLVC